ncbi:MULTISPECIES: hypothetical protein [unclassified Paenibacillus]|uniref:ATP-dependent DNA ligase n=1 Tax=unclassified Paenibacillus TaxID=185978 RepID=UPI00095557EE|nr:MULTISPECIES: hypothetical protein [unclassified Paenibacillus]ASS68754.1 hypothetical protein CIC07_23380 [Paenibacillus sp. RUD330]SIR56949.1 ATP dependent DNA ligase domain-containing protein [Paenibacillus sp. RU4X]SIR65657.1 ATP dependent DNA ligase domain-containing protein [Paenibacillus sp. RU4T]
MRAAKGGLPLGLTAPMAPITRADLPQGEDWGYQIKWDGVRLLADIGPDGKVLLYSRQGLIKNNIYPEVVVLIEKAALGRCILDGELIAWTGSRPSFQRVLQRERMRGKQGGTRLTPLRNPEVPAAAMAMAGGDGGKQLAPGGLSGDGGSLLRPQASQEQPVSGSLADYAGLPQRSRQQPDLGSEADSAHQAQPHAGLAYVLFDVLAAGDRDLRGLPYLQRHEVLHRISPGLPDGMLVTELYRDGEALWHWVAEAGWEGVVSKRLNSLYKEGKQHKDWFKKKTALLLDVDIVGLKIRDGMAASLVMSADGLYFGSVSLGLTGEMRALLTSQLVPEGAFAGGSLQAGAALPFAALPDDLKKERVVWLHNPFPCTVTGLEITEAGQLRHPKIAGFGRRRGE